MVDKMKDEIWNQGDKNRLVWKKKTQLNKQWIIKKKRQLGTEKNIVQHSVPRKFKNLNQNKCYTN